MRWATHSNYKRRARRRRAERAITHVSPTLPVPPLSWHSRHRAVPAPLALTLHLAQARCSAARARLRDQTAVAQPGSSPGGWRGAIWSMHKPRDGTMHSASAKKRGPRKRRARVKLSRTEREEGEDSGLQAVESCPEWRLTALAVGGKRSCCWPRLHGPRCDCAVDRLTLPALT